MEPLKYKKTPSPVGELTLVSQGKTLLGILWDHDKPNRVKFDEMLEVADDPFLNKVEKQLEEYFANKRKTFQFSFQTNGTPFQKAVWDQLARIPYGEVWSYKEVAEKIGHPLAVRAVGSAIGRNPLSIVLPCHRVVGSNGTLRGFAGGLFRKKILLDLEQN